MNDIELYILSLFYLNYSINNINPLITKKNGLISPFFGLSFSSPD